MKLVIREYFASLRERGELDAVLPDLLTEMGFTIYSRPAIGTRQYGVDIAAVGPGQDGVKRVHLFSVKAGDLDRNDWNTASPQSLRPSLDEIRDVYIASRIPVEYAELPIVICLCFGGDIEEQVRAEVNGYIKNNTTSRITYEEWNGDRLAQAVLEGILREELLPAALRSHLRKAVAMVEEPDIAMAHFATLARQLLAETSGRPASRLTRARLVNICLWIMFVWAREAGNVEAPYRASELAILNVWHMLHGDLGKASKVSENAGLVFNELVELHFAIWEELYGKKILPFANVRHAVSAAVSSYASIDVNLKLFETIGRIALYGLWLVWFASDTSSVPSVLDDPENAPRIQLIADLIDRIDALCEQLIAIIANNRALLSPIGDWQAIDIALSLTLLASRPRFRSAIDEWLEELTRNTIFAFQTHGLYPTTQRSYWDLVEHPAEKSEAYRTEATEGSILYPLLALWATATGNGAVVDQLAEFKAKSLEHCTFQTWLPDEDSEALIYLGSENHGAALTGIPVEAGARVTREFIFAECADNPYFDGLSAIALGHWPVLLVACRYHRLPVPPQVWRDLLPVMEPSVAAPAETSKEPNAALTDGGTPGSNK